MGDWYEFGFEEIDGVEKSGFFYSNKNTGFNEIFVEMTEDQKELANEWNKRMGLLMSDQKEMIKGWVNYED